MNFPGCQLAVSHSAEIFSRENRFRTDRTVLLADDAGPVHSPGEATVAVEKGHAGANRPALCEFI
ncbi:hypothetical protein D3C83_274280 [compost metagenome]